MIKVYFRSADNMVKEEIIKQANKDNGEFSVGVQYEGHRLNTTAENTKSDSG